MRFWSSEHVFDHPWNTVVHAAYRKYPNPFNLAVTGVDVLKQEIQDGVLHNERILQCSNPIPAWATKLTGFSDKQFSLEMTKIDPIQRRMHLVSRNLNAGSFIRVDENLSYTPHPDDPKNKTLLKQYLSVDVNLPVLTDYCEKTFINTYEKNALKGRQGLEWVINHLKNEYNEISKKVILQSNDLPNVIPLRHAHAKDGSSSSN